MLESLRHTRDEFPFRFWVLALTTFVDVVGATLLWPYFSLYVTLRFGVGMTQAGALLAIFTIGGLVGGMIGGALTDRFGRRSLVLFGLVFSALSTLAIGWASTLSMLRLIAVPIGVLSEAAGPARQAMVADLLPEEKRNEGFGILRVVANLAWIIGPTIGGLVANRSFQLLFIIDAIISLVTAAIVFRLLPETRPETSATRERESMWQTLAGYGVVLRDGGFIAFMVVSALLLVVYQQLYTTLSVYLRDYRGIAAQGYGLLLSINAVLVVLSQFWLTRKVRNVPPNVVMAAAALLYMLGFGMYGFVGYYALMVVAVLVITVGEMLAVPTSQSLAALYAPEDYRGRYMAAFGLSWAIPSAVAPVAGGMLLDRGYANWVWYLGGVLCAAAAIGFLGLHRATGKRIAVAPLPQDA